MDIYLLTVKKLRLRGGGRGIRTPGTLSGTTVFKTAGFNRSPIPPRGVGLSSIVRRKGIFPAGFGGDEPAKQAKREPERLPPAVEGDGWLLLALQFIGQGIGAVELAQPFDHAGRVHGDGAVLCAVIDKIAGQ